MHGGEGRARGVRRHSAWSRPSHARGGRHEGREQRRHHAPLGARTCTGVCLSAGHAPRRLDISRCEVQHTEVKVRDRRLDINAPRYEANVLLQPGRSIQPPHPSQRNRGSPDIPRRNRPPRRLLPRAGRKARRGNDLQPRQSLAGHHRPHRGGPPPRWPGRRTTLARRRGGLGARERDPNPVDLPVRQCAVRQGSFDSRRPCLTTPDAARRVMARAHPVVDIRTSASPSRSPRARALRRQ